MRRQAVGVAAGVAGATAGLALLSRWQGRRAEALVPPDGRFVEVDGARLHYTDEGTGPPVVMVHGLGGQLRNFSYALSRLVARDARVVLIDRPRSGYSTVPGGSEPGVVAQGALIAAAVAALGLERPLYVGHSLGGAIGLALALGHPGVVRGLALIAPLTQAQPHPPAAFRGLAAGATSRAARLALAHTLAVPLGRLTSPATLRQVFAPEPPPADFATRGGGALALRPGNVAAAMFELGQASDEVAALSERYRTLGLPVSILFGREDAVLDWRRDGEATAAALPQAQLETVAGGHMLPVAQPERTAAFIARAASWR